MSNTVYYIWLSNCIGQAHRQTKNIFWHFGNVKNIYDASISELTQSKLFSPAQLERLSNKSLDRAEKIMEYCQQRDYKIVTLTNKSYPKRLAQIFDPPILLYVQGSLGFIEEFPLISVVGTRKATEYGLTVADRFSYDLAYSGVVIVSGCAVGIDTAAHKGALLAGGRTIGVLGCGIDANYNMQGKELRDEIAQRGAIISEYEPTAMPTKYTFPVRNRIMAGLSNGTLVIEANAKSGSLITANLAAEQGRDVYAVPGSLLSEYSNGVNKLLQDGASVVTCAMDIILNYASYYDINTEEPALRVDLSEQVKSQAVISVIEENLSFVSNDARELFDKLPTEPIHIDKISELTRKPVTSVISQITELELSGLIKTLPGSVYLKNI